MWYSSVPFILAIAINMQSLQGVLLMAISFNSKNLSENVGLSFGEPMDNCDDPNNNNFVRLVQMGLSNVGKDFVKNVDVKFVTLEDNNIGDLSVDAFRSVPNLSCLNIRKNRINRNSLFNLRHNNLRKLNLANNKILFTRDTIKEWNVSLPRLTHLDFRDNDIRVLPPVEVFQSSFPSLTHFYFSWNLNENYIFYYLSSTIEYFYLESATIRGQGIVLPPRITALFLKDSIVRDFSKINSSSLRTLSIRNCDDIKYLIYYINAPNLVDLDLSSNNLKSLPTDIFSKIRSLERLSLEDNLLSSFSVLNKLHLLTDLSLNFNYITNITVQSMGDLDNLKRLHLRGNRISLIEKDAFSKLHFLEQLDLSQNKLIKLPATWMPSLQTLSHLDLRSNLFATIDDMSVNVYTNSMKNLYLGKNNFTRIDMSSLEKMNKNVIIHVV